MLRRDLIHYGFRFPRFEIAAVRHLTAMGHSHATIKAAFPLDDHGIIDLLINSGSGVGAVFPVVTAATAAVGITKVLLEGRATRYLQDHRVGRAELDMIESLDPRTELIDELPAIFAEDVNVSMARDGAPRRVVLFFDAHEAFWGDRRGSGSLFFESDEWFRRLLASLDRSSGVVVVVAGREQPRWDEAISSPIPAQSIASRHVGHFHRQDALSYVAKTGITDGDLQRGLIDIARVMPDDIHPLYLALAVDVARRAAEKGTPLGPTDLCHATDMDTVGRRLLDLLLKYADEEVRDAVRALGACRSFDEDLYEHLGRHLTFHATKAAFRTLVGFSFVWETERVERGQYRIHDLVRRLLHERDEAGTRKAHEELERFYRDRSASGEIADALEYLYHANRVDWKRGIAEWISTLDETLHYGRYDICASLLTLRDELIVDSHYWTARVSMTQGEYFQKQGRYLEAAQAFQDASDAGREASVSDTDDVEEGLLVEAAALGRLGEIANIQARYQDSDNLFQAADAVHDHIAQRFPISAVAQHNRGTALQARGQLQLRRGMLDTAASSFEQAEVLHRKVAIQDPGLVATHNELGNALEGRAMVEMDRGRYDQAIPFFKASIESFDSGLAASNDLPYLYGNKANAFQQLAEAYERQGDERLAIQACDDGLDTIDKALDITNLDADFYNNKAAIVGRLSRLHMRGGGRAPDADEAAMRAIKCCETALELSPTHPRAAHNMALSLSQLAETKQLQGDDDMAIDTYEKALPWFEQALTGAAGDTDVLMAKAGTLFRLGQARHRRATRRSNSIHEERLLIRDEYQAAIDTADQILAAGHDLNTVHLYRGQACAGLAYWNAQEGNDTKAINLYRDAVASCDKLSGHPLTGALALALKAQSQLERSKLEIKLNRRPDALESVLDAAKTFRAALVASPDDVDLRSGLQESLHLCTIISGK